MCVYCFKYVTTTRAYVERNKEDNEEQEVPLQAPSQALIEPIGENVSYGVEVWYGNVVSSLDGASQ